MTSPDAEQPHPSPAEPEDAAQQGGQLAFLPTGRNWVGLAVIAVVVVGALVAAVAYAMASGRSSSAGPSAAPPGISSATAGADAPGTVVKASASAKPTTPAAYGRSAPATAAGLAASGGALRLPSNERKLVLGWASGPGGKALTLVSRQSGFVLQAGGVRQYGQMKYGCIHLAAVVAAAHSGPPIPDMKMQKLYATALSTFSRGATDCLKAISAAPAGDESVQTRENSRILNRSKSELAAGSTELFKATEEIDIASRSKSG